MIGGGGLLGAGLLGGGLLGGGLLGGGLLGGGFPGGGIAGGGTFVDNSQIIDTYTPPPAQISPYDPQQQAVIPQQQAVIPQPPVNVAPACASPVAPYAPPIQTTLAAANIAMPTTVRDCDAALIASPANVALYLQRGILYYGYGQPGYALALADLDAAVILDPNYADALYMRAWIRATCCDPNFRNGAVAVADANKACELTNWTTAGIIDGLGAAYAEAGDFANATMCGNYATQIPGTNAGLQQVFQAHLVSYSAGSPIR